MITMPEMLRGKNLEDLTEEQQKNLAILFDKVTQVRTLWGKPMTITNCVRTMEEHLEIYRKKGITDPAHIPMHSKHLVGAAVDIADSGLEITEWLKGNPQIMEDCDIWCEDHNSNWVHIQILPFGSYHAGGIRWFNP